MSRPIFHATVLNLHQPWGNLESLLQDPSTVWEAKEILYAYDRIPRAVEEIGAVARVHLSLSGTLLECLSNPDFQSRVYGIVQCGGLLWKLRHPSLRFLGTGYYHPVFPLIPKEDRAEHIQRWMGVGTHLLKGPFQGFWPPELGFAMELIPLLKQFGFNYVIVDSEHIVPKTPMRWEEVRYRPHLATFGGEQIVVVPRDRELSIAQESGLDPVWFVQELKERTQWCDFPPLVCTATDGDNGGWFRNTLMESNFWGAFYKPLCDMASRPNPLIKPVFVEEYLDEHGPGGEVIVKTGSWNTGEHSGVGFMQWTGSRLQQDALQRVKQLSREIHHVKQDEKSSHRLGAEQAAWLEEALWHLLRAETSCNFFWGEAWVGRCTQDLDEAQAFLKKVVSP